MRGGHRVQYAAGLDTLYVARKQNGVVTEKLEAIAYRRCDVRKQHLLATARTSTMRRATSGQVTVCIARSLSPKRALQKCRTCGETAMWDCLGFRAVALDRSA